MEDRTGEVVIHVLEIEQRKPCNRGVGEPERPRTERDGEEENA